MPQKKKNVEVEQLQTPIAGEINEMFIYPNNFTKKLLNLNKILLLSYFKESFIGQTVKKNQTLSLQLYGELQYFRVVDLRLKDNENDSDDVQYLVTKRTQIYLAEQSEELQQVDEQIQNLTVEESTIMIYGVDKIALQLKEIINISLNYGDVFIKNQLTPIKGVVIHGPSGVGKSSLVQSVIQKLDKIHFYKIDCGTLLSKFVGESENKIQDIFTKAKQQQPSIVVFDDIHILCNKKSVGSQNSLSILTSLVNEMDRISRNDKIILFAITKDLTQLDDFLRRAGRFDKDIKVEVPQQKERLEILENYLKNIDHSLNEREIIDLNDNMNGFTGADIVTLLRESVIKTISAQNEHIEKQNIISKPTIESVLSSIHPSGLKDLILEIPKVLWSDIGGYEHIKKEIKQVIEWPLKHPEAFVRMGIQPSKGILLYGPPGCSKTMIAKAIATESSLNFIAIKGPELFSKYVGDSEKAIRDLFRRARLCSPCIIFFDEIDAIATQRSVNTDVSERVLCQLLTEMDGVEQLKQVIIVAATNRPDIIDKALTRPGRFDHLIYIPPPDFECREQILNLNIHGKKMPVDSDVNIKSIAFQTGGYSGAELCLICREAGLNALSRDINESTINADDFVQSMKKVKPRITQELITYYTNFGNNQKMI